MIRSNVALDTDILWWRSCGNMFASLPFTSDSTPKILFTCIVQSRIHLLLYRIVLLFALLSRRIYIYISMEWSKSSQFHCLSCSFGRTFPRSELLFQCYIFFGKHCRILFVSGVNSWQKFVRRFKLETRIYQKSRVVIFNQKYNQFITILFLQLNALVGYLLKYIGLLCLISGILQTEGVNLENLGLPVSTTSQYSAVNNSAHYGKVAILGFHSHRYLCMGKNGHIYTRVSTSLIHSYIVWWHTKLYSWIIVTQNYFRVA